MLTAVAWTMLLNLMRVAAVAALAATWRQTTAVLFLQRCIHDLESFEELEETIA